MARLTAVIDIGSNSARLVIFQKTSRFGFHLLCQHKSKVRIGEGAYLKGGMLQAIPMQRAYDTLKAFKSIIKEYRVNKTICIATSALRDAPNRQEFIKRIKKDLQIDIKVIDGNTEAKYGAIAAGNLLPVKDAVTIDIGGGSADMARITGGKIAETFSLDLGTVRLKELFTTDKIDLGRAADFIEKELARLPDTFKCDTAVGIGGTARALSRAIMVRDQYPFDKIHAFRFDYLRVDDFFDQIIHAPVNKLDTFHIKEERFDTIREGTLILRSILRQTGAKNMLTSGVGVREGVYLHERLRKHNDIFPNDLNPSIQSIKDRFDILDLPPGNKFQVSKKLFELFEKYFGGTRNDKKILAYALKLSNIGKMLTIYKEHQHAYYIAMQELNFGFRHEEMILIATILRSKGKKYYKPLYKEYKKLLPPKRKLQWLVFVYSLSLILHENSANARIEFAYHKKTLQIKGNFVPGLAKEELDTLPLPREIHSIKIL